MEKEKTVLEVCTDSIESAIAAKKGGADRIELCSNLIIGGTTPDTKMYRIIQNEAGIPARILIRPRFGDFCYSKYEKELILEQNSGVSRGKAHRALLSVHCCLTEVLIWSLWKNV